MQGRRTMKDHNEMYHMDYKDTKKQAYKDKSDGSVTSRRGLLTGRSGHGSRISRCFAGGLIRRIRTSAEQSSSQPTVRRPSTVRDCSSRGVWKHNIHAPVWKRAGHFDGARYSPHKPDVAIPRSQACRGSHRNLLGPAGLRPPPPTCCYRPPFSLFKARNRKRTD